MILSEPLLNNVKEHGRASCANAGLRLVDVSKQYADVVALRNANLDVRPGEFVTLLGPSGSGKTTTLEIIAGFERPSTGQVWIGGKNVTHLSTHKRNLGMVFQGYALFPHMTVFENVAFPLGLRKVRGKDRKRLVERALGIVALEHLADRYPRELSGGQQQRVALARSFVYDPSVLLMDEPLSALDRNLREQMQEELRRIHRELGSTVVYVTHDQEEALSLSDKVVLLRDSCIEQVGTPREIYDRPKTQFAASFLGTSNFIPISGDARAVGDGMYEVVVCDNRKLRGHAPEQLGSKAVVMVRAEDARNQPPTDDYANNMTVKVISKTYLGGHVRCVGKFEDGSDCVFCLNHDNGETANEGEAIDLYWPSSRCIILNSN